MDPPAPRDALAPDYLDDRDWVRSVRSANADPARLSPCEFPSRDRAPAKQQRGRARSECPRRGSFEWRTARQQSQEPPPFLYATAVPEGGARPTLPYIGRCYHRWVKAQRTRNSSHRPCCPRPCTSPPEGTRTMAASDRQRRLEPVMQRSGRALFLSRPTARARP